VNYTTSAETDRLDHGIGDTRYESVVYTIVQSLGCYFSGLITRRQIYFVHGGRRDRYTVNADSNHIGRAHSPDCSVGSSRSSGAMIGSRLGKWLPLLFAATTAIDGWLTLGSLAQSTVIAAAVLRRLGGKVRTAANRTNDLV